MRFERGENETKEGRMRVTVADICWQIIGTASQLSQWLRRIHRHLQREVKNITMP